MQPRTFAAVMGVWLVVALIIGASGALARSPVPPPMIAMALTVILLLALRFSARIRAAAFGIGAAPLVAFHLLRIAAGAYFLVLYGRGALPEAFAVPAGVGDIIVGVAAGVMLWLCVPVRTYGQRMSLMIWNVAGLLDILGVLGNGIRLFVRNPSVAEPFMTLPLALLPTFVVPIVIVSHVLLFAFGADGRRRRH